MPTYPGLYRAKAVQKTGTTISAFIPQIFGSTQVTIADFVGTSPVAQEMGWVAFQNGAPEYPVWFGNSTGDGGTVTDVVWTGVDAPVDATTELWWDTDAPPGGGGAKPAVTGSRAGNAALTSLLTQLAALGIITDSTTP